MKNRMVHGWACVVFVFVGVAVSGCGGVGAGDDLDAAGAGGEAEAGDVGGAGGAAGDDEQFESPTRVVPGDAWIEFPSKRPPDNSLGGSFALPQPRRAERAPLPAPEPSPFEPASAEVR